MANTNIVVKLRLSRWEHFGMAIDPARFDRVLQKHVGLATAQNAKRLEREVRQAIKGGVRPANAALTIAIKGSDLPLVDRGSGIFQAITSQAIAWDAAFVGVKRTSQHYNIARTLNDGASIKVTEKMRWLFRMLWWASEGRLDPAKLTGRAAELWSRMSRDWKPLAASTDTIFIPGRSFAAEAFSNPAAIEWCRTNWETAVRNALKEMARV